MRLLHVKTRKLQEFFGVAIPPYAILSHTWGSEEVTFNDLLTGDYHTKHGYIKIDGCCQEAVSQGMTWVWVDSCCIDKSSSAELSEAINSMFNWYQNAKVCFVYLEDVLPSENPFLPESTLRSSRWWTRGWTLQELLAPRHVIFFDKDWDHVFTELTEGLDGDMSESMALVANGLKDTSENAMSKQETVQNIRYSLISTITGIPRSVLMGTEELSEVAAAVKFSWAAKRHTTRIEDAAYCLLGLLGVNMPLLYGEGDKAFVRLQQAVISGSDDISMLSWGCGLTWEAIEEIGPESVLANSPSAFREYPTEKLYPARRTPRIHSTVTGHGLHVELPLILVDPRQKTWLGIIEQHVLGEKGDIIDIAGIAGIAIVLRQKTASDSNTLVRARGCPPIRISSLHSLKYLLRRKNRKMVYLQDSGVMDDSEMSFISGYRDLVRSVFRKHPGQHTNTTELAISISGLRNAGYILSSQYPPIDHDLSTAGLRPMSTWQLNNGRLQYEQQHFESLLCHGPHELFYFILTGPGSHRVAVKVRIKYNPPNISSFQVLLSQEEIVCKATALEHVCKRGLGPIYITWGSKELSLWQEYVNLWNKKGSKIHVRALPSQQDITNKYTRYAQCDLAWSGGWVIGNNVI
ncbi:unnamed protein product [Periconia digitata]|uniref:Heterokaryon incompatibility domain-containing protein n=1 Tax=Periconia digitata TaxID=1303443 RepID=A0A9W4XKL5_9PLEO|nr:unnamed protein product [Periconia digitata]